jgi:hypothetical protein
MTIHKKLLSAAAALVISFSAVPFNAYAARTNISVSQEIMAEAISYSYFETVEEAGAYVRAELKKHTTELHIRLAAKAGAKDILNDILSAAFAETGKGDEGEFLRLSIEGYRAGTGIINHAPAIDISFLYNGTLEEDMAAKNKADEILAELDLEGMDEYEKTEAVYQYLVSHVVYSETENNEIYTAYGALINNDAVCQGFIQAMYYMLTESGVKCRAVMGKGNGGDHVWAIAGIDGKFYYLDPTWDSEFKGKTKWFFLKGINDFDENCDPVRHIAGSGDPKNIAFIPDCTVESFLPDYPISEYKYVRSTSYLKGDINNDKIVDVYDFIAFRKGLIAGFDMKAGAAADFDGSGKIEIADAVLLRRYLHGLSDEKPADTE